VAEQTEGSITINASAADVMAVIEDFEAYPQWNDITSSEVVARDPTGRASEVEMRVKAPLIGDVRYVLQYTYRPSNAGVSWTTKEIEGGIRDITGEYELEELDAEETKVTYRMSIDLKMKVPGFLRKQGERQVVDGALKGLKKRVEQG
jgi:ribosome-associated toxin RatA of RatAB toxin-antitoxin module